MLSVNVCRQSCDWQSQVEPLVLDRCRMKNDEKKMTKSTFNTLFKTVLLSMALVICSKAGAVLGQVCCEDNIGISTVTQRPVTKTLPLAYSAAYPTTIGTANTYKIENETVYREEQQSRLRQVWDDEIRERRYTVYRQIPETIIKQEIYKVLKPTWTTEYRDTSYDVVRTVPETSMRQERYTVSRPVWETAERDVWQTVRRPVQETYMQERRYVVNRPVTSYKTEVIDRGQYVNQTVVEPGKTYHRLAWHNGGTYINPDTGASRWQLPGLYWTPMHGDPKYRQESVYQPNLVEQLTPVTSLVPETVVEQIPIARTTYQEERILKKEPYQVMRMVQEERTREIPETRYRQIVERVQQTTPVQVYRLETQEVARDIPVTSYKTIAEERVEQYSVKVPRIEQIFETVQKPYTVQKRIPLDEFGNPINIYPGPIATPSLLTSPITTPANQTFERPVSGDENGADGSENDPANEPPTIPSQDDQSGQEAKPNSKRFDFSSST